MKKMAYAGMNGFLLQGKKVKPEVKGRAVPVLSESRKRLFAGIETSSEFSSAAFYERYSNIKKRY
ncbi:hypothetical protein [Undibacterium luofuense]|uniref:Uncharacterized protein n=1 Tax=Undibacterium luofuense TaxID=2828733 RepID=A0A941DJE8_9BURK|nr:hypothetical protein [Undibacterium luofuense]MBR7781863.1 hypothetical protein [Undibacterium luofuense]